MTAIIDRVEPGSIAEELEWMPGDEIVSVNGHVLSDLIDYRFHINDENLKVLVRRGDESAEFEIEKDIEDDLGVTFEDALFDGVRTCGAHCIFCFVEQLPNGLRKSLYLKDDDYRLSFLHGNYVTLANVTDADIERIVQQRLSPLYVSVHTTDSALRQRMLGRKAPGILDQIDALSRGNISLHTQIVLCRGINDGTYLQKSIEELAERYPTVQSIAVVPVGLTAHRRNTTPIGSIDAQYSAAMLDLIRRYQRRFLDEKGTRFVWAADELFLSAGDSIPKAAAYEGFPQIENGVGLARKFIDSAYRAKRLLPAKLPRPLTVSLVTGTLAAPVLRRWAESVACENLRVNVFPISNRLFGESVTVTGLIAGQDVIDQLKGQDLGELLVIPSVSVRAGDFLDDVTLADVERALGVPVRPVDPSPTALIRLIIER